MFHRIAVWRVVVTLDFSTFSTKSALSGSSHYGSAASGFAPQRTPARATRIGLVGWKAVVPDLPGLRCPWLESGHSPPEAVIPYCAYFSADAGMLMSRGISLATNG